MIASVKDGLRQYVPFIPTRQKQSIQICYHVNVAVDSTLQVIENSKKSAPRFAYFSEYRDYLQRHVQRLFDNAGDRRRQVRFEPLSTISKGYDSSAAAVLARDAGCREAVTIDQRRRTKELDSGAGIADILGLEVRTFGRLDYRSRKGFPEAEFSGGPSELASMADAFAGRIVSTGYMGDCVWDLNFPDVTGDIVRGSEGGSSVTEFRLRHGFVHLPVPFIGCTSHPAIHAISTSDEMKPWRIGGRYDRPIARRILEDAGVPREMVGMRKGAVAVYVTEEGIDATLGPESLSDFNAFLNEYWDWSAAAKCRIVRLTKTAVALNEKARKASVLLSRRAIGRTLKLPRIIPRPIRVRTYGYIGRESLLFHWGMQKLVQRYRAALVCGDRAVTSAAEACQAMQ